MLDFLSYPDHLCVGDLLPKMINGVLLSQSLQLGKRERIIEDELTPFDSFELEVQDSTGEASYTVHGGSRRKS